jgi:hypothetical protein
MAFNQNSLVLVTPRLGEGENAANAGYSSAHWTYRDSGGDALATMAGATYLTGALDAGMKVGDTIDIIETGTAAQKYHVTAVAATGATLVSFVIV